MTVIFLVTVTLSSARTAPTLAPLAPRTCERRRCNDNRLQGGGCLFSLAASNCSSIGGGKFLGSGLGVDRSAEGAESAEALFSLSASNGSSIVGGKVALGSMNPEVLLSTKVAL